MKSKLSERLKSLRAEKGIAQQKFADDVGLSAGFVAMIETNRKSVSIETLIIFAEYFKVSSDYLIGLRDD